MDRGMPTRSDQRPRLRGVMVGTSDGVGAYAMKVSSPSALGGGGGGGGATRAAARFLAMRSRSCSRLAAMRSSSVLYLRGMMRSGIIMNEDDYDDESRRWQQSSMMGMVGGNGRRGWE
jgi:hypothetical protein